MLFTTLTKIVTEDIKMKLLTLLLALHSILLLSSCREREIYYTPNYSTTEAYYTDVGPAEPYYHPHTTTIVTQTPVAPNSRIAHHHRHHRHHNQVAIQTSPVVTQTPPAPEAAQINDDNTSVTVTPPAP
jgi:ABC-type oligopeptide transport system substrate-binding subunit